MNWINIRVETLRRPDFVQANRGAVETWLRVMAYCCEQENNGCIFDGMRWNDRAWMTTCGVSIEEVRAAYPLVFDDGVAVFVIDFPSDKQAEVVAKRKAGSAGGKKRAKNARASTASPVIPSTASPESSNSASTEGEGEGKENSNGNTNGKENGTKKRRVARSALECPSFKEFWGQYPRREAIADAEAAWVKNGCASLLPVILTKIRERKPQWLSGEMRFIPLPATWLNRRGWEDELLSIKDERQKNKEPGELEKKYGW